MTDKNYQFNQQQSHGNNSPIIIGDGINVNNKSEAKSEGTFDKIINSIIKIINAFKGNSTGK